MVWPSLPQWVHCFLPPWREPAPECGLCDTWGIPEIQSWEVVLRKTLAPSPVSAKNCLSCWTIKPNTLFKVGNGDMSMTWEHTPEYWSLRPFRNLATWRVLCWVLTYWSALQVQFALQVQEGTSIKTSNSSSKIFKLVNSTDRLITLPKKEDLPLQVWNPKKIQLERNTSTIRPKECNHYRSRGRFEWLQGWGIERSKPKPLCCISARRGGSRCRHQVLELNHQQNRAYSWWEDSSSCSVAKNESSI